MKIKFFILFLLILATTASLCSCGYESQSGAEFCVNCGAEFSKTGSNLNNNSNISNNNSGISNDFGSSVGTAKCSKTLMYQGLLGIFLIW